MSKDNWSEVRRSHFLHGSRWTEGVVNKLEEHIRSAPEECCCITDLALSSGVIDLWKQDQHNPFSFIAWLSTTDDLSFEETCPKSISEKLYELIINADISQALKESLHISCSLRDHFPWDKETINEKVERHGINYINLQAANLEDSDLSDLRLPANLRKANLRGANLSNTDLRGAYLQGAIVSEDQLADAITNHTTELPIF